MASGTRCAQVTHVVVDDDTAAAMHCGEVPVLATPRVLALAEEACCKAVNGSLLNGDTTVGMRAQLDHLAPVNVGSTITAEASLERVEGRRLIFTVTVTDEAGLIAAGRMTRVVVHRDEFLERAR